MFGSKYERGELYLRKKVAVVKLPYLHMLTLVAVELLTDVTSEMSLALHFHFHILY
jgi:hypothetical protein